jgi:hypothetical protein
VPARRTGRPLTAILELPRRIAVLDPRARAAVDRLLDVQVIEGSTVPPAALEPWLRTTFGSADAVRHQRLVRVTNLASLDAAVFASLRGRRPMQGPMGPNGVRDEIAASEGDPFCDPEHETPANAFGRVRGRRMITGANAGLAEAHHAVLVFDRHDPLAIDGELVTDLLETARAWAERARATDPEARHYLLLWNCLWRAGGSIIHGHAQALVGRDRPHAAVDRFLRDAAAYRERHGTDLVGDLVTAHRSVGLAVDGRDGVTTLSHLVPVKEREILVVGAAGMDEREPAFADAVADALAAYLGPLGVRSFNLALWRPPLNEHLDDLPPIVRLVDRGDPLQRASDIGAMELYGSPIVTADPYDVIAAIG